MNKPIKIAFLLLCTIVLVTILVQSQPLQAQGVCDFFPCGNGGVLPEPGDPSTFGASIVRLIIGLVFTVFIGFGVLILVKGSIKIIQSEGDESKVEEGAKAFRGVFIGIGMLLVGIVGLAIVFGLAGNAGFLDEQIEAPEGVQDIPFIN